MSEISAYKGLFVVDVPSDRKVAIGTADNKAVYYIDGVGWFMFWIEHDGCEVYRFRKRLNKKPDGFKKGLNKVWSPSVKKHKNIVW